MKKTLLTLALCLASAPVLAAPSFSVGGVNVTLPSVEQGGRIYVQLDALAKALGITLRYDAASKRYTLQLPAAGLTVQASGPQGNGQLAGGNGKPGEAYTVGDPGHTFNFTLKSAEYLATRVNIGGQSYVPKADEKLLVLHYTVQNPGKTEQRYDESSVHFMAVDDQDINRRYVEAVGREGGSEALDLPLKPAQKIDAFTVIRLPAGSSAPKLIVEAGGPVLRYDLHGVVKGVAAPYADPQNPQLVRAEVPGKLGSYVQLGALDARIDAVSSSDEPLSGQKPADGHRFLVATVSFRNSTTSPQRVSYNGLSPQLLLASGDKVEWNQTLLKAGSDAAVDVNLKPGEEMKTRIYFEVPASDPARTLTLAQEDARRFDFDVSGAK